MGHEKHSRLATAKQFSVGIVGSGPAGLMAATVVAEAGFPVTIFEREAQTSRKLFIAGSSGLNVSSSLPVPEVLKRYSGPVAHWQKALSSFSVGDWLDFLKSLGLEWFQGTSARYFVRPMNATPLVRAWRRRLTDLGAKFETIHDCIDFDTTTAGDGEVTLKFREQAPAQFASICFALGGASYPSTDRPVDWPKMFETKNIPSTKFSAVNVGFTVNWSPKMLQEAEGKPLKNIVLKTSKGVRMGELVVTAYGLEGTPVYEVGEEGLAHLDLKPDLSEAEVIERMLKPKENLNPLRRLKKTLKLCPASLALIFHHGAKDEVQDIGRLAKLVKNFPLNLLQRRPIEEAISTAGGVSFSAIDENMMICAYPGVFVAGEMLDWDAPTGGFLIQGCVSEGFLAGQGIVRRLRERGH